MDFCGLARGGGHRQKGTSIPCYTQHHHQQTEEMACHWFFDWNIYMHKVCGYHFPVPNRTLCIPIALCSWGSITATEYYRERTPSHSISPVCSVLEHPQTSVSAARTPSVSQTTQSLLSWSTVAVHPSGQIHSRELGISSMIITKWCNHSILVSYGVSEDFFFVYFNSFHFKWFFNAHTLGIQTLVEKRSLETE